MSTAAREATSAGARFGRLERGAPPAPMSDINMTPLVDVMLVLVVIFILTAPLLAASIRLDLPRSEAARVQPVPHTVRVALDKTGQLYFNQQPVNLPTLRQRLVEAAQTDPQAEVQLLADESVPYGQVVAVMGAAHQAGLSRIGFIAKP